MADPLAGAWFFALGSRVAGSFAFQLFSWACMFGAVMSVTPARRYWATALMCALALTVALHTTATLVGVTVATANTAFNNLYAFNSVPLFLIAPLAVFALLLWPVWRWYDGLVRALMSR